jgi:hypothetical protein
MDDVLGRFIGKMESTQGEAALSNEEDVLKKDHSIYQAINQSLKNKDYYGDIRLKKLYGISILIALGIWESFVVVFMFMQICPENRVSEAIIISLLTSATANILVLPTIVLKYLFPDRL